MNIAVFASGSGSNFQSLVEASEAGSLGAEISLLVCDRKDALVLERAKKHGIPTFVFTAKDYGSKAEFERKIIEQLRTHDAEFIALAGYMRLIGETLLKEYGGRIINIHPSLLPAFPGKDAIGQALEAGVKISGVTIHYVDEGMDTGGIIAQEAVPVLVDDDHKSLQQRIQAVEHDLYPRTVAQLLSKK